jgi:NFU1 iron-sulfur cluster scaffold homolog, mitochondrial
VGMRIVTKMTIFPYRILPILELEFMNMRTASLIPTYVYTEMTPNPNSMKFVADRILIGDGQVAEFISADAAKGASHLAYNLFNFPFVKGVFVMGNFVTVNKDESIEWDLVKNELREFIQRYLMENQLAVTEGFTGSVIENEEVSSSHTSNGRGIFSELEQKIADLLDEYVRPAVERDGGAIQLDSFSNGTVKVVLRGACSGCPSSTVTLKDGIENLLTSMLPEVHEVIAIDG